ncbi:unnamed protein product [Closterium sp. Yama58-4]|nr:unnamed protein product [Closterium sp. Yama58-4]
MHTLVENKFHNLGACKLVGTPSKWRRQYLRDLKKWSVFFLENALNQHLNQEEEEVAEEEQEEKEEVAEKEEVVE